MQLQTSKTLPEEFFQCQGFCSNGKVDVLRQNNILMHGSWPSSLRRKLVYSALMNSEVWESHTLVSTISSIYLSPTGSQAPRCNSSKLADGARCANIQYYLCLLWQSIPKHKILMYHMII